MSFPGPPPQLCRTSLLVSCRASVLVSSGFFPGIVCFRWRSANLHLRAFVQPVGAGSDDSVGGAKTAENLRRLGGADAECDRTLGSGPVGLDDQNKFADAISLGLYCFQGNDQGIRSSAAGNGAVYRRARL